jgi:hypothetical protein
MVGRITFTLPASFQPREFLHRPQLAMHADDARWLISTILNKTANRVQAYLCAMVQNLKRLLFLICQWLTACWLSKAIMANSPNQRLRS